MGRLGKVSASLAIFTVAGLSTIPAAYADSQPTSSIQQPTSSIQQPTSSIQQPTSSIQQPTSSIQQPVQPNGGGWGVVLWKITGVGAQYTAQSAWHAGDSGWGPGTLGYSQTFTMSNGVSGSVNVSDGDVSASVGWNVTASYSATASYSVNVPAGKEYQIQWAGVYTHKPVYQTEYQYDEFGTSVIDTATCNASEFSYFAYRWISLN